LEQGTYPFTISVTDANNCVAMKTYTMSSVCTVSLSPGELPDASLDEPYAQNLTASGGTEPYEYFIVLGTLPPGLALSSDGLLSGTPTKEGVYQFNARARDAYGCAGSRNVSVTVMQDLPPPPSITPSYGHSATPTTTGTPTASMTHSHTPTPSRSVSDARTATRTRIPTATSTGADTAT